MYVHMHEEVCSLSACLHACMQLMIG